MNINSIKVITPDNLGKGITFNPQTKQWEVQSGFDCAALSALPSKPWKKGTTLLAKQDGECIQLTALDSIFQEIGVGIAADKTSAFTGETYNVTVTVTNTGESKNKLTNLTVQKPLLGNYEILGVRTSKQAVDEVERLDDLNYNLKGLAKGGTFILRFSVKANDVGTYQFSATVNPNSALDQNAKNNTDTIILKANTKIDTTYVPSVDCPRITATELDSNTVLQQLQPTYNQYSKFLESSIYPNIRSNIFANRTTLKGLRIHLDNASSVIGHKDVYGDSYRGVIIGDKSTLSSIGKADTENKVLFDANAPKRGAGGFTFSDGVLEITEDIHAFAFSCRPQGQNCRWQVYSVYSLVEPKLKKITTSNNNGFVVNKITTFADTRKGDIDDITANIIPASEASKVNTSSFVAGAAYARNLNATEKLILTVRAGTAASINFTSTDNYVDVRAQGKTTITENRVTVSADATSTDSINSKYLQVIVED